MVFCQKVLSPSVEAGDKFLHAPPVSEVLGALDRRDASLECLALEGEEEVVGFQLQDEVRDDLDKCEVKDVPVTDSGWIGCRKGIWTCRGK